VGISIRDKFAFRGYHGSLLVKEAYLLQGAMLSLGAVILISGVPDNQVLRDPFI
jgi:hypothetical protein